MPTDNHNLRTPSKGETDWHVPINENTTALDTLIEIRDVDANRSEYMPKDGGKYLSIDTGDVYVGDGNEWKRLGPISGESVFDARSYEGRVGGDRIQAALDDAATVDQAVVVVDGDGPDDVTSYEATARDRAWLVTSALEVPSRATLRFRGAHLFLDDDVNQNVVRNAAATSGDAARDTDISIRGDPATFIDGNGTGQDRSSAPDESQTEPGALEHFGVFLHKVDRCRVGGFGIGRTAGWGVVVQDFTDCVMHDLTFRQDAAVWNQDGCAFIGPGDRGRIDGITGTFGDDFATIYCTADWLNDAAGPGGDVSNVTITDCNASPAPDATFSPGVRLQTGKGTQLSDVLLTDLALDSGHVKLVNCNDPANYDDLQNVSISNVVSAGAFGGLSVGGPVQNVSMSNVHVWDSDDVFFYVNWDVGTSELASARHVTVENCTVESDAAFLYSGSNGGELTDITFRDVSYSTANGGDGMGARILLHDSGTGRDITFEDVRIEGDPDFEGIYVGPEFTLEDVRGNNLSFSDVTHGVSIQSERIEPPVTFTNVRTTNNLREPFYVDPTGVVTNGIGVESANADEPSTDRWATGTMVDFTDTGDGSGTGTYLLLPNGRWSCLDDA